MLPTVLAMAGSDLPVNRTLDGFDMAPVLFEGKKASVNSVLFDYDPGTAYTESKGFLHLLPKGSQSFGWDFCSQAA